MSNYQNRFNFTGTVIFPKDDSKFYTEGTKDKREYRKMMFGVKESDNNAQFVSCYGSKSDIIKTMDTDNNKIEIAWDDRFDDDVVKKVANYKKTSVNLGEEFGGQQEFVTTYDAMEFIYKNLPKYKGKVTVTGQFTKSPSSKGTYFENFNFTNIYAVSDDTKNRLKLTIDTYYNRDSLDKGDFKDTKKMYLNGYILQYINKDEGSKFIPMQFVFNASKYNMDNEKHKALFNYKMEYLDTKSKTMVHIPWDIVLLHGAEEEDWDESKLTEKQMEQVTLGIKTVDDFKPRGKIFGNNVNEYRLFDPKLIKDFSNGLVDSGYTERDFEDLIYVPVKNESVADVLKKSETKEEEKAEEKDEESVGEDDLF